MQAEIITIGDEILIGQIIDSNSAFISKALNNIGVHVYQITSVQDDKDHILTALAEAESRVDVVIMTGGLGPTKDDITKHTLCEYFNDELVMNREVLGHVEGLFEKYITTPISDLNRRQALVPSGCRVLKNRFGTAPGMWMEKNGKAFVSLPGVPYEMKALMEHEVLPLIQEKYHRPYILHKTMITYGLGESAIAEKIEAWEDALPSHIKLAYLPNLGKVRLRLTARGEHKEDLMEEVDARFRELYPFLGDIIVGFEEEGLLEVHIGKLLQEKKATLAVAESCTGGTIASRITMVPGASNYFLGGVVSYATEVKTRMLGVDEKTVAQHSVVSAEVAEAMALGVREKMQADYGVATTGNAGPAKGESDAEVGTVFIAIASEKGVISEKFNFGNHREKVINRAVNKALEMLRKEILKK
ncbi:competence/damage-inducible protein A [Robertkochia marina]|uniref:CinA-like protein n=1 Tax=Robertkochia marina TaxID=1227945 RepID=A0A4S3LWX8_9FLAO|nr:competence/damage-inducible protein A [Robertkochia marina]THD65684.1 competence/damage-inducible protein A [Robertkochia marina]TRZ46632.1 competence/damage-inducible protein A [Robertkochia marina]